MTTPITKTSSNNNDENNNNNNDGAATTQNGMTTTTTTINPLDSSASSFRSASSSSSSTNQKNQDSHVRSLPYTNTNASFGSGTQHNMNNNHINNNYSVVSAFQQSDVDYLGDNLVLGVTLGEGAYGVVRSALDVSTGALLAVKTLNVGKLSRVRGGRDAVSAELAFCTDPVVQQMAFACAADSRLHPVTDVLEVSEHNEVHLVTPLAVGTVRDILNEMRKQQHHQQQHQQYQQVEHFTTEQAMRIIRDVALALATMHALGWAHKDVKASNVLLHADGGAMLTDYDCVERVGVNPNKGCLRLQGTLAYQPPELSDEDASDPKKFHVNGFEWDVWSLGVLAFVLLSPKGHHHQPFQGKTEMMLMDDVVRCEPNWGVVGGDNDNDDDDDDELRTFLKTKMIVKEPKCRASADEVVAWANAWMEKNKINNNNNSHPHVCLCSLHARLRDNNTQFALTLLSPTCTVLSRATRKEFVAIMKWIISVDSRVVSWDIYKQYWVSRCMTVFTCS
eukprot:PhM_4_TR14076/c0_g1_i1/m.60827/K07298/STK11, LKB1; serine/threonine-protein kinase 11